MRRVHAVNFVRTMAVTTVAFLAPAHAEELLKQTRESKRLEKVIADVELTAITIRERAVDRAIELKKEGRGPDRILMMVSTSASHMKKNSGLDHAGYWAEAERSIRKAHDAGLRVNGTVSTIWDARSKDRLAWKTR